MNYLERPSLTEEVGSSRARYKTILPFCASKRVIDYGCGIGIGSYFLSHFCQSVCGYDIDNNSVEEARKEFQRHNLTFLSDRNTINWPSIEVVVSNEMIEHLKVYELPALVEYWAQNCKSFVGTTPNGDWFAYHPRSTSEEIGFHKWHYTYEELGTLFGKYYRFVDVTGHVFDPKFKQFTGYTVVATNDYNWNKDWLTKVRV